MHHPNRLLKLFFIFNILLSLSNCQLKIPLKYFPIYKYDNSSPSLIMQNIILQKLYANFEIGTPKQTIQIPIYFNSNDFFISDNPKSEFGKERFSNLKFYGENGESETLDDAEGEEGEIFDGDIFGQGFYKKDVFYFNDKKYEMNFYIPFEYEEVESGGLGLQLLPYSDIDTSTPDKEKTFLEKIKNLGLIKDYYFSIFYNSKEYQKEEEGFLLVGSLPHEVNNDTDLGLYEKRYFNRTYLKTVKVLVQQNHVSNQFSMDYIYAYEGINKEKVISNFPFGNDDYLKVKLDYHSGGVKAPTKLEENYKKIFEEYITKEECFSDIFKKSYNYYYCKKNQEIISKIKNVFPSINFKSNDLNYNFTLEPDDLFVEENEYIFCLLFFEKSSVSTNSKIWILGKPFLKKYQFTLNYNENYINFYYDTYENKDKEDKGDKEKETEDKEKEKEEKDKSKEDSSSENTNKENKENNGGISTTSLVIIIIVSIIIILLALFLIYKYCLSNRLNNKAKASDIENDNYSHKINEIDNLDINKN